MIRKYLFALSLIMTAGMLAACDSDSGESTPNPGQAEATCSEDTDCSGDTPVCNKETKKCEAAKSEEDSGKEKECEKDADCNDDNKECKENKCVEKSASGEDKSKECESDADCKDDAKECKENKCVEKAETDIACTGEEVKCDDNLCHNLKSDVSNCNECGHACNAGELCNNGTCELSCQSGQVVCGSSCTDVKTDASNCNECGKACGSGQSCEDGACKCPDSKSFCENGTPGCYDLTSDASNCGECGKVCNDGDKSGYVCKNSACVLECNDQTLCKGADNAEFCTNVKTDTSNCGECGKACNPGDQCIDGKCVAACDEGKDRCEDGECYDLDTDNKHCGDCAKACDTGAGETCENGECVVKCSGSNCTCENQGDVRCSTDSNNREAEKICVNPKTSNIYCGCDDSKEGVNCAKLANAIGVTCVDGACNFDPEKSCRSGFGSCDNNVATGCETDLTTTDNCGACGNKCDATHVAADGLACILGKCHPTCETGYDLCDGKCLDLSEDVKNCGFCGNECDTAAGQVCEDGFCTVPKTKCEGTGDHKYASVSATVRNSDGTLGKKTVRAYCIMNSVAFENMRSTVNTGTRYPNVAETDSSYNSDNAYILMSSIMFGNDERSWEPIGTSSNQFNGIFLGNGKQIRGTLKSSQANSGLFGYVKGASLDGFYLRLNYTNTSGNYTGALAGYVLNSYIGRVTSQGTVTGQYKTGHVVGHCGKTTFSRIKTSGTVKDAHDAGGVIGSTGDDTDMEYITVNVNFESNTSWKGGIVGSSGNGTNGLKLKHCEYKGTIKGTTYIGGIVGGAGYLDLEDCVVNATINASGQNTGGIAGLAGRESSTAKPILVKDVYVDATIKGAHTCSGGVGRSYNKTMEITNVITKGSVSGNTDVSGIAGYWGSTVDGVKITNCHSSMTVTGTDHDGGLVGCGSKLTMTNSSFTGTVTSRAGSDENSKRGRIGGLAGYLTDSTITNSFSTGNVIGTSQVGGLLGGGAGMTITNAYATGSVIGEMTQSRKDGQYVGGLIGYLDNATLTNVRSMGSVTGGSDVGGLVGYMKNSNVSFSEAFGSASGIRSGGLIGSLASFTSVQTSVAIGDAKGEEAGSLFGTVSGGTHNVSKSYATGAVSNSRSTGHMIGKIDASGTKLTLKKTFYWKTAAASGKLVGTGEPAANPEATPFIYDDTGKEATLEGENASKLVETLNGYGDNWMSATCTLSSGPGSRTAGKYTFPVLKVFGADICE